jgi:hypothetical protein
MVVADVANTIAVKVTNLGTTAAADFSVRTGIYDFSNSQSDLHLCTNFVTGPLAHRGLLRVDTEAHGRQWRR